MHVRKHSLRFCLIFISLLLLLVFFAVKLILIQVLRSEYLTQLYEQQHNHGVKLEPVRGTIYDRHLRPLAVNVTVYSLFANPRAMGSADKRRAAEELPSLLGVEKSFLEKQLRQRKYFVWLARKLPMEVTDKVRALKIHGLDFLKESKRYYPNNYLAAHVIGFAGVDNEGLEGLEMVLNKSLKGEEGWAQILRDAQQRELLIEKKFFPPKDGFSVILTLDETIQYITEKALQKAFEKNNAKSATMIVMDPRTGEILALANRPTYNLSQFEESTVESRTNRAIAYVYEPGSVFKIVAASAAVEEGAFQEDDKIFCENGTYKVGGHILHDAHAYGTLTFKEVIMQSSNIGTTKVAQKLGADVFFRYAQRFHFGRKTGVDLWGEVDGLLKPPSQWSKTTIGAMPIGHEVTVTPIQLVCAISAIANNGVAMRPFIVKYIKDNKDELIQAVEPEVVSQVITPQTAERVTAILEAAVEAGTGKRAQIKGVRVAGKTGTAQKVMGKGYSDKYYASFIGFAPVDNPRLAAVVVFEEPHPSYYGGTVAAPVFQEVISDSLKYLDASASR